MRHLDRAGVHNCAAHERYVDIVNAVRLVVSSVVFVTTGTIVNNSPTPDFAPSPAGWAGIIVGTALIAFLATRLILEAPGILGVLLIVVASYFLVMGIWGLTRNGRDQRAETTGTPPDILGER